MNNTWGTGEYITLLLLIVGGTWFSAKVLGLAWRVASPHVLWFWDRFFIFNMLSDDEIEPRTSSEPPEPTVIRRDTNADRTTSNTENEPAREPAREPSVISTRMGRDATIALLAMQRDEDGKYVYSANKIAEFVGGTRSEAMSRIAELRGAQQPRQAPKANSLQRPKNGW